MENRERFEPAPSAWGISCAGERGLPAGTQGMRSLVSPPQQAAALEVAAVLAECAATWARFATDGVDHGDICEGVAIGHLGQVLLTIIDLSAPSYTGVHTARLACALDHFLQGDGDLAMDDLPPQRPILWEPVVRAQAAGAPS